MWTESRSRSTGVAVPVVDTVAAGDAFCGAFARWLMVRILKRVWWKATGAGALAVGVSGATPSLPLARAVEELIWGSDLSSSRGFVALSD